MSKSEKWLQEKKAKEYYRDMLEHDYPLLQIKYGELQDKLSKAMQFIKEVKQRGCDILNNNHNCLGCMAHDVLREIDQ